jgi:ornithine--oxo-acid transaminase
MLHLGVEVVIAMSDPIAGPEARREPVAETSPAARGSVESIALEGRWGAHNYHPLPVVGSTSRGAWITDPEGRGYLDCLAGYSALNFGHGHPALLAAAHAQLDRLTLTSRAFHNDRLGAFLADLADLTGTEMVLPMNTGAEAVETAIKVARAWGYRVKGVPHDRATIVTMAGGFHGRTTTIISFSDDPDAHDDFGPYTPGFVTVPYADAAAVRDAIDDDTVAVLLEPIQGEAGIIVPPAGYLADVRAVTRERGVLLIADEIQSGLGRTGATLETARLGVRPDLITLGKALGGGIVPVSALVGRADVIGVIRPGEHGSTFGGNPLAAAVGQAVVDLLRTGEYQQRARELGAVLHGGLTGLVGEGITAVRGVGLWAGIDVEPELGTGRQVCERLAAHGVLAKDTHGQTLRLAPPLIVSEQEIAFALDALRRALVSV